MKTAVLCTILLLMSAIQSGCTAGAVAAAGVTAGFGIAQGQAESFINGELKAARMVPLEQAEFATHQMMTELKLRVIHHRRGKYDAYIKGVGEGGPEIKITLSQKSPVITKIETRVGIMGDQSVSRLVMARIDVALGIEHPFVPVEISPVVAPKPSPPPTEEPANQPPAESKNESGNDPPP